MRRCGQCVRRRQCGGGGSVSVQWAVMGQSNTESSFRHCLLLAGAWIAADSTCEWLVRYCVRYSMSEGRYGLHQPNFVLSITGVTMITCSCDKKKKKKRSQKKRAGNTLSRPSFLPEYWLPSLQCASHCAIYDSANSRCHCFHANIINIVTMLSSGMCMHGYLLR